MLATALTRRTKVIERTSAALLAAAGPLAAGAAEAVEVELRRGLAACAGAEGELVRLACYDKLAADNGLAGPQPRDAGVAEAGKWQVSVDSNPVDDSTRVVLRLTADSGRGRYGAEVSLIARCQSNETDLYVNWASYLGLESTEVTVRVGREKASVEEWGLSTDNMATFAVAPIPLLRRMAKADTLLLQVTPYSESPVTAVFDTRGLAQAVRPLAKECGWTFAPDTPLAEQAVGPPPVPTAIPGPDEARGVAAVAVPAEPAAEDPTSPSRPATGPEPLVADRPPGGNALGPDLVEVRVDRARIRSEPGPDGQVAFLAEQGEAFLVLERREGWIRVQAGPKSGWVRADMTEPALR